MMTDIAVCSLSFQPCTWAILQVPLPFEIVLPAAFKAVMKNFFFNRTFETIFYILNQWNLMQ